MIQAWFKPYSGLIQTWFGLWGPFLRKMDKDLNGDPKKAEYLVIPFFIHFPKNFSNFPRFFFLGYIIKVSIILKNLLLQVTFSTFSEFFDDNQKFMINFKPKIRGRNSLLASSEEAFMHISSKKKMEKWEKSWLKKSWTLFFCIFLSRWCRCSC